MSKRLVTGMVLALALTSTAVPASLAADQVTSVLTPADISGPEEWAAANDAVTEALDAAKTAIDASKAALDASKAAQAAAEGASSKVVALATSIDASLSNLKTNMASLSSLLERIAKKIGA
jgi:hypothetical protein